MKIDQPPTTRTRRRMARAAGSVVAIAVLLTGCLSADQSADVNLVNKARKDARLTALTSDKAAGGIFNLGSGRSTSINDLAAHAAAAFGHKPGAYDIRHAPARPGEQRRVQADIGRAQSVLGWQPRTTFEQGLAETVRSGRASTGG